MLKISYLTEEFYKFYNYDLYPEILKNEARPYIVWLVKIENNIFGIPFRTNISHKSCYKFKKSNRDTQKATGLDFSKAVVLNNEAYIGVNANIDNYEYSELDSKKEHIFKRFETYIKNYIKYAKSNNKKLIELKYKYSTLTYFHRELGLI